MTALLLALQLALPANDAATPAAHPSMWAKVDSATRVFLLEWRMAWVQTQRDWPPEYTLGGGGRDWYVGNDLRSGPLRLAAVHCHFTDTPRLLRDRIILNSSGAQASCPTWYPPGLPALDDERRGLDGGLERELRPRILAQRHALRVFLEQAADSLPGDVRLAGQRVRFALDAGALRDAWAIATSCTAEGPACDLLRGLVLYRGGFAELADSTFLAAAGRMNDEQRCAWNDVRVLLDREPRERYAAMDCAERADVEARLWWLADPLFLEAGNERRAEHFARKTHVALLAPLGDDGRLHFRPKKGGEAVIETLVRYGWPSQYYWAGPGVDRAHDGWLIPPPVFPRPPERGDTAPPYVVPEYTTGRLHVVPTFAAILAPFEAAPHEWQLNAAGDLYDWWPAEHFARDRGDIVQLPDGQTGVLRRRDATRFLWAGDLESARLDRPHGDTVRATLFAGHAVGGADVVGTFAARVCGTLVIEVPLPAGPALIGIEASGDSARPAARTRFGTPIPEPLSRLGRAQALSPPLLFEPLPDASTRVGDRQAVARLYGTTRFNRLSRVGVYWEAYGFTATDTVDVELRVERQDRPGILGRAIDVLGIGEERQGSGALRWRELPGQERAIQVMEGGVPVQMRSVTVDLSRLARGTYRLTLSMQATGRPAVSSERTFELR